MILVYNRAIILFTSMFLSLAFGGCGNFHYPYEKNAALEKNELVFFGKIEVDINEGDVGYMVLTDYRVAKKTDEVEFYEQTYPMFSHTMEEDGYFFLKGKQETLYFYMLKTSWREHSWGKDTIHFSNIPLGYRYDFKPGMEAVYVGDIKFHHNKGENKLELIYKNNFNAARKKFIEKFGDKLKYSQLKPEPAKNLYIPPIPISD